MQPGAESSCSECLAPSPPRGAGLDAVATLLESDGVRKAAGSMVSLERVLTPERLAALPESVVHFYKNPLQFRVTAAIRAHFWSRLLLSLIALLSRQAQLAPGEHHPLCQWLYVDGRGRTHWDRYACVRGRCRRLFTARMEGSTGYLHETFVIYGLPAPLTFGARVEGNTLVLALLRRLGSPLSWFARVEYRTEAVGAEVHARGAFRIPLLGFHVQTEFRAVRHSPA